MNIAFFINDVIDLDSGIGKKILSQAESLQKLANNFYFIENSRNGVYRKVNDEFVCEGGIKSYLLLRYKFETLTSFILNNDVDVIYIRYTHFSSPSFICFLRKMYENDIKVILEFPTYPYDQEYSKLKFKSKTKLVIDKIFRSKLSKYVNCCVSFTDGYSKIFGIDVINISNALNVNDISSRRNKIDLLPSTEKVNIVFTAVASMYFWHGYDRFINAISDYIENDKNHKEITFNLIGDGPEIMSLKKLVRDKCLNDNVIFHGYKKGDYLDEILLKSDVGVDSLGRFRSGNDSNNSLKSKEYLSFGLPIIKSHKDNSIDNLDMIYNVDNNENNIDLSEVIEWYDDLKNNITRSKISSICLELFTWDVQMEKVLNKILEK